jgi:lysine biosynthesis protein LysW
VPTATCPECETDVFVGADSEQGSIITCDECHAKLELVGLDPIELDLTESEESMDYGDDEVDAYDYAE